MKNVFAQVNIGQQFNSPFGQTKSVGTLVSLILNFGLIVAGVIIVFLLVFGAIKMIAGAGGGDAKAAAQGHQAITWAVIGFVVVFSSFIIIRLIETLAGGAFFVTAPNIVAPCVPGSPC